jgi:hypothetical protein
MTTEPFGMSVARAMAAQEARRARTPLGRVEAAWRWIWAKVGGR